MAVTPDTGRDSKHERTGLALLLVGVLMVAVLTACGSKDEPEPQPAGLILCEEAANGRLDQRDTELKQRYPGMDEAPRKLASGAEAARICNFGTSDARLLSYGIQFALRQPIIDFPEKSSLRLVTPDPKTTGNPDILPDFFETDLHGTGLFAAWSNLARPDGFLDDDVYEVADAKTLQMALGHALADVTDPGRVRAVSPDFVAELHRLGATKIQPKRLHPAEGEKGGLGSVEYGWSIFAPLLRFGDFHESSLVPLAVEIFRFDQANGGNWAVPGQPTHLSYDMYAPDATTGMDAVLEALSRNRTALEQVATQVPDPRLDTLLAAK